MEIITEKDKDTIEQWYKDASKQTIDTLPDFMNHVLKDYKHDYGTICKAIGACAIAAAWAANASPQGGITGFQAGEVMWDFIRNWNYRSNECGLRIVDYDNMLYPQYENKFAKTITLRIMDNLMKEARKLLQKDANSNFKAHPEVRAHWERIAQGFPPFGYELTSE